MFEVGDKVKVIGPKEGEEHAKYPGWSEIMDFTLKQERIVESIDIGGCIYLDGLSFKFLPDWLELVADETENKDDLIKELVRKVDQDFITETFHSLPHESILTEAERIVHGEGARNVDYGHPLDNFNHIAHMFSAYLGDRLVSMLTAEDVAAFNIFQKISRQSNAQKRDNLVDLAGYAETWQWVIDEREARKKV